jgi:hypothetical protein
MIELTLGELFSCARACACASCAFVPGGACVPGQPSRCFDKLESCCSSALLRTLTETDITGGWRWFVNADGKIYPTKISPTYNHNSTASPCVITFVEPTERRKAKTAHRDRIADRDPDRNGTNRFVTRDSR